MNVLFVASEAYPLIKTGGLADVVGALPFAMQDIPSLKSPLSLRLLLPNYPGVMDALIDHGGQITTERQIDDPLGADVQGYHTGYSDVRGAGPCRLIYAQLPRGNAVGRQEQSSGKGEGGADDTLEVLLLDCAPLYARDGGPYVDAYGQDHADNFRRFAALSRTGALLALGLLEEGYKADVVHAHDWQTGLIPAYIKNPPLSTFASGLGGARPKTLLTIHNIDYLGLFGREVLPEVGLPESSFNINGIEFYGLLSYLKAGCYYADHVNTVSPTYAQEIQAPGGGKGLEGLLAGRAADGELSGILNGIDTAEWDPQSDPHLAAPYSLSEPEGKAACKRALQEQLGLYENPKALLFGVVSRLVAQKGIDLVLQAAPEIIENGGQIALLGSGDPALVEQVHALGARFPGQFGSFIGYGEELSHRIQAGADVFMVPSRFEPCGLTQMYALRYGTLPLVRHTGGLADTVVDCVLNPHDGTGFVFDEASISGLMGAVGHAFALFHRPEEWRKVKRNAMRKNFAWNRAAEIYAKLYRAMVY